MSKYKSPFANLGMESKEDAEDNRRSLVRRLKNAKVTSPGIDKLMNCNQSSPCYTEACPVCRRRFRQKLVRQCHRSDFSKGVFTRVSGVPVGLLWSSDTLQEVKLPCVIQRLRKQIERSGLSEFIIIGGLDISYNTFNNDEVGWQGHIYLLINTPYTHELRQLIRDCFKADPDVPRPFSITPVRQEGFFKCLTYSYKNGFYSRSGYPDSRLKKDDTPRKNTRSQGLKLKQDTELAAWLAEYPVGARLIMRNVHRTTPPNSRKLRLRPMKPIIHDH